ncbi:MAG: hypothetical protein H7201_12910 [Candidatus Saccharibacteria bacterium]|nr:hypothetical protein [Microbacteriaceae bacterium]
MIWLVSAVALSVAVWLLGSHMKVGQSSDEASVRVIEVLALPVEMLATGRIGSS